MLTCGSDMTVVSLTQSSCDYAQDETFNTAITESGKASEARRTGYSYTANG